MASCGSIAYVSPDVLKGEGYTDKCDLWSLGVIVFMLLAPPETTISIAIFSWSSGDVHRFFGGFRVIFDGFCTFLEVRSPFQVGYPPFHGSEKDMRSNILCANVDWSHKSRWRKARLWAIWVAKRGETRDFFMAFPWFSIIF